MSATPGSLHGERRMNLVIVTACLLALGFTALGAAKIAKTSFMQERAEHVGFSADAYRLIGIAEVLGAAGVLAGLAFAPVGFAAGLGLLLLLAGAVGAHIRSGARIGEIAPAVVFAVGTITYLVALGVG